MTLPWVKKTMDIFLKQENTPCNAALPERTQITCRYSNHMVLLWFFYK